MVIAIEEFVNYEKIVGYTSKTFLKMAGGKNHTLHPTPRIRSWP